MSWTMSRRAPKTSWRSYKMPPPRRAGPGRAAPSRAQPGGSRPSLGYVAGLLAAPAGEALGRRGGNIIFTHSDASHLRSAGSSRQIRAGGKLPDVGGSQTRSASALRRAVISA